MELPPEAVERFRADLDRLQPDLEGDDRFGVAVSGGPDSLALLLLAHAALPGRVVAATVDHGLRPESSNEASFVANLCRSLGIDHETLRVEVGRGNLQDRARAARYAALLRSFGMRRAGVFATAHHADDQAETVLMRLARGSGLEGLSGVRARRVIVSDDPLCEYLLLRPLLGWRKSELAAIVEGAGIEPVRDPSNDDDRFDRVRVRRMLDALPDLDPVAIARSAEWLQDAGEVVADQVATVLSLHVHQDGKAVWFYAGWPRIVEVEVVVDILRRFGSEVSRTAAARLVLQMRSVRHATLGGVRVRRALHRKHANTQVDAWLFEREGPRRSG
ncbi:tRNA lysidine(34) synthetase TilS [Tsuneonella amylolytica]|uniref:tRNA lysidine(34) synthetase TilS n=1 Tax=Tsuneonella amylolytica TaxID=2338327 RepID=UPI000EAA342F|nr:tRNA lysidine(34) synthetase TilS [Tsuneonella amylolytica]